MKEKMAVTISDINKRALQIVKEKGYTPSIYDDKTIPLKVLNSKLKNHKYRIRHYKPEDIEYALKIINDEKFVQEVVDEYMLMAHSKVVHIDKDYLDTRIQEILKYIKSLYISNIAYEKELKFTRSMDKSQFIENLNELNERGSVRITMSCIENTRYFNIANNEEKDICEKEIEKASTASIVVSLINKDVIERRGFLINEGVVNQISKEDIVIGDVTNRYTREYIGPVPGTIYYD
jgi:ribosome assembly protein YihI (activator of Der GTPase)